VWTNNYACELPVEKDILMFEAYNRKRLGAFRKGAEARTKCISSRGYKPVLTVLVYLHL
jgi:hypothetical protein